MKQAARLLKGSALQVFRDQMLLLLCFAPFLAGTALKIVIPLIDRLLIRYLNFTIAPYYLMADAFILSLGSMMIGMMVGLLMLDERDDGIFVYYSVTPVGGRAYLLMRLGLPFIYSVAATMLVISYSSLGELSFGWMPAPVILSSLNGVFMSMLLAAVASNKVEGLAVSKLLGIIIFGIPLAWFADSYLRLPGYFLPTYWIMEMLMQAASGDLKGYITDFVLGLFLTSLWIMLLYRLFRKKIG